MLLEFLRRFWLLPHNGFAEQSMLDARRARLLATMANQAAQARAERAAHFERSEIARVVADRERRAAAMGTATTAATSLAQPIPTLSSPSAGADGARGWRARGKPGRASGSESVVRATHRTRTTRRVAAATLGGDRLETRAPSLVEEHLAEEVVAQPETSPLWSRLYVE